jgi:hypothetical protein
VNIGLRQLRDYPPSDVKRKLRYWAIEACEQREDNMFLQSEVDRIFDFAYGRLLGRRITKA